MKKLLVWLVPVALFGGILLVFFHGLSATPVEAESPMVGKPVPEFTLAGYNGVHPGLATSDLRQGSVTLVNVFGTWCPPCMAELPTLAALAEQHGVTIHAIAYRDTPEALDRTFRSRPNPFRRIGMDQRGEAVFSLGVTGAPETFIVDGKGIIRYRHVGEIRPEQVDMILARIAQARKS